MKRLHYIPGLLSLGLLLPLCIWYLYRLGVWEQERCITMTFPIPDEFRGDYSFPPPPTPREVRTVWTEFVCDGDPHAIDGTLLAFRDSLRELESRGDTTRGIHVRFGPDTKYATMISAIDICWTTVRAWELNDHDLWTLHYPEPKPDKAKKEKPEFYLECGTIRSAGCIVQTAPSATGRLKTGLGDTWTNAIRPYWMIWSLLLFNGTLALRRTLRAPNWAS